MQNNFLKTIQTEKGVALIITFFIMVIILASVLSLSVILYSEIKVIKNIGNSVVAFYAADSGIEKILFYDKQVLPLMPEDKIVTRGLCSMCDFDQTNNPDACVENPGPNSGDKSIHCNNCNSNSLNGEDGCNPDVCNNCEISFDTNFNDDKSYYVKATVTPNIDGTSSNLVIQSKGSFNSVERQVEINSTKRGIQDIIKIEGACVRPKSAPRGDIIEISAFVSSQVLNGVISSVLVDIKDASDGEPIFGGEDLSMELKSGNNAHGLWEYGWSSVGSGAYYVDIIAQDSFENIKTENNIPSCN